MAGISLQGMLFGAVAYYLLYITAVSQVLSLLALLVQKYKY
jgi:hypothetical protein